MPLAHSRPPESKEALVEEFRRDSILKAARRVIAQQGLSGASMQAIAGEAGVAKGTLYLYFRDRDDLLVQAAGHVFDELLARLKAVLGAPRPLAESLRDLVRTKIEFFDDNQEFLRVYMALRHSGDVAETRRHRQKATQYRHYVRMLGSYLALAVERGEMKPRPPERVALFLVEGVSAILLRRLEERERKGDDDAEWIVDLLMNGLARRKP